MALFWHAVLFMLCTLLREQVYTEFIEGNRRKPSLMHEAILRDQVVIDPLLGP